MGKIARMAVIAGTLVVLVGTMVSPASARSRGRYNAIPPELTPNVPSYGFEAYNLKEFGDLVGLQSQHGGKHLSQLKVVVSSWACRTGRWYESSCNSPKNKTYPVKITANIYAVSGGEPGALLATLTKTFNIKYRPAADNVDCTGGAWYNPADSTCYNGRASVIAFNFTDHPKLPSQVVWTVAYNTSHAGYSPKGELACYASSGGCGYDSFNIGVKTFPGAPYVGTDVDPNGAVANSPDAGWYCDGGAGGTNTLRVDTNNTNDCYAGYTPLGKVKTQ